MQFSIVRIIGPTLIIATGVFIAVRVRREKKFRKELAVASGKPLPTDQIEQWGRGSVIAMGLAAFYLLLFRLISLVPPFYWDNKGGAILMSLSFLFIGPFVAGFLVIYQPLTKEPWKVKVWIMAPWIPVLLNIILALSAAWEGIICVIFILPPAILAASLGGVTAGLLHRYFHRRLPAKTVYSLALIPFLLAIVETRLHQPLQTRTVDTSIVIHAPLSVVWQNIERVSAMLLGNCGVHGQIRLVFHVPSKRRFRTKVLAESVKPASSAASTLLKPSLTGNRTNASPSPSRQTPQRFPQRRWTSTSLSAVAFSTFSLANTTFTRYPMEIRCFT